MVHTECGDGADLVARVVEEYFERLRRGENPQLEEFVEQYPEISDLLRTVIPGLQVAEQSPDLSANGKLPQGRRKQKQIGDFRILRQIGRGGMGIVYEAEQISMNRRVALKVLPLAGLVDELKIRRFQNEVRAVAALDHPNVVSVYTVGEERGVYYYAMQLIRGRSLSEIITSLRHIRDEGDPLDGASISRITNVQSDGRPVSESSIEVGGSGNDGDATQVDTVNYNEASTIPHSSRWEFFRSVAALGIQAATALQHAHDQGVMHRDVKPANLLLDRAGQLHLTDFGLARIESDVGVTMTGDLVGTLRYMAPEQALAKRVVVDHRADIYSLAVTLYELLTLRPAFLAEDRQQLLKQIAFEDPTPLRHVDRDIPSDLETIVHKAMSKDAAQRYACAQELADDLRSYLDNRAIAAKPPSVLEIAAKWTRRNLVLTWASIITLTLVTVTLAAATLLIARQRDLAEEGLARATTAEREADLHLLDALRQQAHALRRTGVPGQRLQSLDALRKASTLVGNPLLSADERGKITQELRNEALTCLSLPDYVVLKSWPAVRGKNRCGVSLTARRYAVGDAQGNITIYDLDSATEVAVLPGEGLHTNRNFVFSPDGNFLAAMHAFNRAFAVWQIDDCRPVLRRNGFDGGMDFFSNSEAIVVGESDDRLLVYSTKDGALIGDVALPALAKGISVHPSNSTVAVSFRDDAFVIVYDLRDQTELRCLTPAGASTIAWSPSGDELCVGLTTGDICIFAPRDPQATMRVLRGHNALVSRLSFLHGGRTLVSHSWDATTHVWDVASSRQVLALSDGVLDESDDPSGGVFPFRGQKASGIAEVVEPYATSSSIYGRYTVAIHPQLPFVVVGGGGIAHILHLKTMERLAWLPICSHPVWTGVAADTGEIITSCKHGLYFWPVSSDGNEVKVGPPTCAKKGAFKRFAMDAAGKKIAVVADNRVLIFDREDPDSVVRTSRHGGLNYVALSPDARSVVTSTWNSKGVRVFETTSGRLVRDLLPDTSTCSVQFAPDGETLITGTRDGYSIWNVATWELIKKFDVKSRGGSVSFASNAERSWMAMRMDRSVISLRRNDGEELARLRAYPDSLVNSIAFSPPGDYLVGITEHGCRSWDLAAVSKELQDLGLGPLGDRLLPVVEGRERDIRVSVDFGDLATHDRTR